MNNAIEVTGLTKYYGRRGAGVLAVDHVSFDVQEGEVFGFLGPNGAGKTTTQRMLTTLLEPTEGRIVIVRHDLAHDAYPVKRQMGLVPEESNVYTELTAQSVAGYCRAVGERRPVLGAVCLDAPAEPATGALTYLTIHSRQRVVVQSGLASP